MKRILFALILLVIFLPMVKGITYSGTCDNAENCTIVAQNYTAYISGCTINSLIWNGTTADWASGGKGYNNNLGQIFTTVHILSSDLTDVQADITNGTGWVRVNCRNGGSTGFNDWYFYETYINLTQNATATYIMYNYPETVDMWAFNKTNNITAATLANHNTYGGIVGYAYPSLHNYTLGFSFPEAKTMSSGFRTPAAGPPTVGIARGNTIAANTSFNVLIKVMRKNESAPDIVTGYLNALNAFKANPLYGDTSGSPCTYSGSGNWYINNCDYKIATGWIRVKP